MSKYTRKNRIAYRIEQETGTYPKTHIRIQTWDEVQVSERIYWSCREPEYYGSPERFQSLAVGGHEVYYEVDFSPREVYLSYQHYSEGGYCSHTVETSGGLTTLQWATKLLTRVSREVAKAQDAYYGPKDNYSHRLNSPQAVIEALEKMGAVEIEHTGGITDGHMVKRFSPSHTWMTKEVA